MLMAGEGRTNEQITQVLQIWTTRVSKIARQRFGAKRLAGSSQDLRLVFKADLLELPQRPVEAFLDRPKLVPVFI